MHPCAMTERERKQQFLACLGDPSRFSMVTTLAAGPRCVTELAHLVGLSQSCTTRHLQALLREGIVSVERQGKRVVYELRPLDARAHPVLRWACEAGEPHSMAAPPIVASEGLRRSRRSAGTRMLDRRSIQDIEVTDAMVVGHDSAWESSDAGDDLRTRLDRDRDPGERLEVLDPESGDGEANASSRESDTEDAPAGRRATRELDDFLL